MPTSTPDGQPLIPTRDNRSEALCQEHRLLAYLKALGLVDSVGEAPLLEGLSGGQVNRVYRVSSASATFIVKEVASKYDPSTGVTLTSDRARFEYDVLGLLASLFPRNFPRPLLLDTRSSVIILESAPSGSYLLETQLLHGTFDSAVASELGHLSASLHRRTAFREGLRKPFANQAALDFKLMRQCFTLRLPARDLSRLRRHVQRMVANTTALVHGDLCPKNVVVTPRSVLLIDLEEAHYGNPIFDVAYLIAHYWLIGVLTETPPDLYLRAISRFLSQYTRHVSSRLPEIRIADLLTLVAAFVLGRLDGPARTSWCRPGIHATRAHTFAHDLLRLRPRPILDAIRTVESRVGSERVTDVGRES